MKSKEFTIIKNIIKNHFDHKKKQQVQSTSKEIPLAFPPYDWKEVCDALESMLNLKTTMDKKVERFEQSFAKYIGVKYAVMVNSGSSANLLALSVLSHPSLNSRRISQNDEIITPAVTWSTSVFPITNVNAVPVFVDVDPHTFNIDPQKIEDAISNKTKAIMPIHLLGFPCAMKEINRIAKKYNLFVIEDCCEALGASYKKKKVGSFGDVATFSFFASHHITTMEGGMLVTDDLHLYELAKSIRTHGWTRDLKDKIKFEKKFPKLDSRFIFANVGYNLRPTELQGAFGIHQLKKLDKLVNHRIKNAKFWKKSLSKYSDFLKFHPDHNNIINSNMIFPITVIKNKFFNKNDLISFLEKKNIATRPVMAGNMIKHPVMEYIKFKTSSSLKNSNDVLTNSFLIGNHHLINQKKRKYVVDSISEFIDSKLSS